MIHKLPWPVEELDERSRDVVVSLWENIMNLKLILMEDYGFTNKDLNTMMKGESLYPQQQNVEKLE